MDALKLHLDLEISNIKLIQLVHSSSLPWLTRMLLTTV